MSTRFNRNDANVPDDRLFPDDFIVDQNGQDADLLQIAADFGCLPCIGSGLGVTEKEAATHTIEIAAGTGPHWAYDVDGHRITVESAQEKTLVAWDGTTVNYVCIAHAFTTSDERPAHRTGVGYKTRKQDSFTITVTTDAPGINDIVLATVIQDGTNPMEISNETRLATTCRLIAQSMVPAVAEEEGTGTGAEPPPPGQQNELPDYPKGRTIPMPIILSGTRNGAAWNGIETILPEELGRTVNAEASLTLERVNLKTGTPLADVKVWLGDWGEGARDGEDDRKCNFTMPTKSGVSAWDDDLWITDPPGYYYLVKHDESWHAKIVDSGSNYVIVEEGKQVPSGSAAEYYICPYAELYRSQAIPYKTDAELDVTHPQTARHYNRIASPTAPIVLVKDLNLGGKYKIKAASVISGDNYTKWVEADFIVGSDLVVCWYPGSSYLNVIPVDGGVEVTIPAKISGEAPEAYELCYTYGSDANPDPPTPDFTNTEHPTIRPKERKVKIDAPPGRKVKVKCRAIRTRTVMRCEGLDKILTSEDAYITAGGVSIRRNRKQYTGLIDESSIASQGTALADTVPLANPVWPEKIFLFNPTGSVVTDIEVYVHGSDQTYTAGRKIEISATGDETEIGIKSSVEKIITDYRITDNAMKITVKNIDPSNPQDVTLRYGVQYREDSESEIG